MNKVLVAGATGYLGRFIVRELKKKGYWIRVLARSENKIDNLKEFTDDIFIGEVTHPESLTGITDGIEYVISSIGITRQKDNLTYMDVDYQGNLNLLQEAVKSNVKKFIYISVLNAHLMKDLKIVQAKERFVQELIKSGLDYTIIRPNGFFSDMLDFLNMAKKGKIYILGNGEYKINPIHGSDLAGACIDVITTSKNEVNIGGPTVYSHNQIAETVFKVINKEAKILHIPLWIVKLVLPLLRAITSSKTYGPVEFFMTVLTMDMIGETYGKESLVGFFTQEYNRMGT